VNLNINTFYNVSYPKNFRQLVTHKTFYETAEQKFYSLAQNLKMRISTNMQEPYASVAEGITVGEQRNLEKDLKDIFKTSGLIHILVLSGANVALIISFFYYFVRKINSRYKRLKVILTLCFGWIFIFMTGITAPSTRAGIMASTNILSEYFSKNISTIYSLLVALFVLSLLSPLTLIFSASLHLSFLACFGLFVLAPILQKYFGNKFLGFFLSVFFGIFLTTTPYILALTGKSSVFGTLLTFLVEPFVVAITILSFTIILASFVHPLLSEFFGVLNTLCVKFVLLVADFGAQHLPLIYFSISKTELIIYYLVLGLIFLKLGQNGIIKKTKEYAE
jgi:competence protein ComEC